MHSLRRDKGKALNKIVNAKLLPLKKAGDNVCSPIATPKLQRVFSMSIPLWNWSQMQFLDSVRDRTFV